MLQPSRPRRRAAAGIGVLWPLVAWLALAAPPAPAQEPETPRAEEPRAGAEAPPPEASFEGLLAEEVEASVAATEEEAAESLLPFRRRSQPLQGLPAAMAALIMGGQPGGQVLSSVLALPLALPAASPDPPADAKALVALFVEVDGPSLLGPTPGETIELEVFAYALGGGGVAGFLSQRVELDLAEVGQEVFAGGVKLIGHLELPPGEYVVRVLVHERSSQRFGLRHLALAVPGSPALLAPLAPDVPAPWLLVVESPHGAYGEVDFEALLRGAGTPPPSALPVLVGDRAELDVLMVSGGAAPAPVTLEARVLGIDQKPAATVPVTVLARRTTDLPGLDRLRVELPLDGLDTGSYYLTLAGASGGQALTSPELPFVLLRRSAQATAWPEIERRRSGTAPPTELDLGATPRRRRDPRGERVARAVERAYATVLARLAGGDREGARADLARIEGEVVQSNATDRPFEILATAELAVLDRLAAAEPEAVLPLALLHADVYRQHRDENAFGLATHSRTMATAAAELYAAKSTLEDGRRLASGLLATIGDELQRAQVRRTAHELLQRAIVFDAENRFAIVSLAAGLEKTADYAGAAAVLERLIAIDPKAPEGRLRLAVNLLRLGRAGEGTATLRRLIDEDNPEWVLTLAYETLASELLRRSPAEAADLLRRAVGRLPHQPRLALQLSYALERAGRSAEASDALARLDRPGPDGPSPRHRYNLWPEIGREEVDRQLAEATLIRLPRLTRALAALPAGRER